MSDELFKKNVCILIDLSCCIIDWSKSQNVDTGANSMLLGLAKGYISDIENHTLITGFIMRSYNYWPQIKERDMDFLVDNSAVLFSEISQENIKPLTDLFKIKNKDDQSFIPKESLDSLWEIIEAMIINCIKYIHEYRLPDKETKKYTREYFPRITLNRHVLPTWSNVKLA